MIATMGQCKPDIPTPLIVSDGTHAMHSAKLGNPGFLIIPIKSDGSRIMWRKCFVPLMVICVSFALLAAGELQAAEKNARPDYKNAISAARETIWKAITSGQGSGAKNRARC